MPDPRLTPEEIAALLDSGDMTAEDVFTGPLSKEEKDSAWRVINEDPAKYGLETLGAPLLPPAVGRLTSILGGISTGGLKEAAAKAAPAIGGAIGAATHHPFMGYRLGQGIRSMLRLGGRPTAIGGGVAAAKKAQEKGQLSLNLEGGTSTIPRPLDKNYKGPQMHGPERPPIKQPTQTSFDFTPEPKQPVNLRKVSQQEFNALGKEDLPPNLTRLTPSQVSTSTMREQVGRGVQNDFRGAATIRKPADRKPEFPPGTSSKSTPEEFKEKSRDFAESQGSNVEVERVRKRIKEELDRKKTQRRKPK